LRVSKVDMLWDMACLLYPNEPDFDLAGVSGEPPFRSP